VVGRRRVDHARAVSVGVEVLGEEQDCSVECLVGLVERPDEGLEHMRHPGCDVEDHVDVRLTCALGQPYGVVEEQFVGADLEQDRREAGQVREDSGSEQWLVRVLTAEIHLAGVVHSVPGEERSTPSFVLIVAPERV